MPKWVWPWMFWYRMFFAQASTLPSRRHWKLIEHGRCWIQNNQFPIKSHVELDTTLMCMACATVIFSENFWDSKLYLNYVHDLQKRYPLVASIETTKPKRTKRTSNSCTIGGSGKNTNLTPALILMGSSKRTQKINQSAKGVNTYRLGAATTPRSVSRLPRWNNCMYIVGPCRLVRTNLFSFLMSATWWQLCMYHVAQNTGLNSARVVLLKLGHHSFW